MSPELRRYLDLEQAMLALDAHGNPEADQVRDFMDGAWARLSPADREWLNARKLPSLGSELRVSVGSTLFQVVKSPAPATRAPTWEFEDWRVA